MSNIHHKWYLLNIMSNGFNSLIIFHAEFFKILSHVNITVRFETDIVSAEHYHSIIWLCFTLYCQNRHFLCPKQLFCTWTALICLPYYKYQHLTDPVKLYWSISTDLDWSASGSITKFWSVLGKSPGNSVNRRNSLHKMSFENVMSHSAFWIYILVDVN